ncbi:response regulator transcription factor [Nonomuraea sp. NPDC059007]|uniref:response regulator transcription factor n=1 Tax=Nonomuraea sp. NPDC059007 TaxID=3346692 RepID=UPI00347C7A49
MTSSARVMVVEDAEAIRLAVLSGLGSAGYVARGVPDGTGFEQELNTFQPDLVVLDLMLPGRDGFALLEVVRGRSDAGVIVLTARDGVSDRLRGLQAGADDYVVKPFELSELTARVGAVLRRLRRTPSTLQIGSLIIDVDKGLVLRDGRPVELTRTELRLLGHLALHRGQVLSKTQLLTSVWGYDAYDPNLVEVHVSALRRKLESSGERVLHTVRGLGYVLDGPR